MRVGGFEGGVVGCRVGFDEGSLDGAMLPEGAALNFSVGTDETLGESVGGDVGPAVGGIVGVCVGLDVGGVEGGDVG